MSRRDSGLAATVSGGAGTCGIQWQRREAGGTWADVGSGQNPVTMGTGFLSAPGVYQVRAIYDCDGSSCAEDVSNVVNIEVFADPEISIESDDVAVCLGETVDLTATVSGE